MNGLRPLGVFLCLFGAVAAPLWGERVARDPDVLQADLSTGPVALSGGPGGLRLVALEVGGAAAEAVPVPDRALPTALAGLEHGWALAGSYPTDGGGRRLFVRARHEAGPGGGVELPLPGGRRGAVRRDPVLFVDRGRLAGMAWLEGEAGSPLAVRAAAWDGERWQAPEGVAPVGPGSQLALAGAVLDDGSWLLVWTAYDGTDDETVWAVRRAGEWLPAARLSADNEVPDITPAVVAVDGGALAAWSRYDGRQYRLRTARFAEGVWSSEDWAGPAGSLFPSFSGARDRPLLLYRDGAARGWAVAELDSEGVRVDLHTAPATPAARPAVTAHGASLRWPASERSAAAEPVRSEPESTP